MENVNRARYSLSDVQRSSFYQLPKFLFVDEFKNLSSDAKILYALLRDRHELSVKNQWVDKDGYVYLFMSRDEMCSLLGCTAPTLRKAIQSLKEFNLMEEVRQGLNKPNIIYLLQFFQSEKFYLSGEKNINPQEDKEVSRSNTYINKTENNSLKKESMQPSADNKKEKTDKPEPLTPDPKTGKPKTYNQIIEEFTDNETLRTILIEYIKMRSLNKKKLTDKALNLLLKKLNSISADDNQKILIVEKSIINTWADFYPLKDEDIKSGASGSFDTNNFYELALRKSYESS